MTWRPASYEEGLRMAWDEDDDGVEHCLAHVEPYLPLEPGAWIVDVGAGVGRLTVPLAIKYPRTNFVALDTSPAMRFYGRTTNGHLSNISWVGRWSADYCHAAYSVVTFQHLTDDEMRSYLTAVGQAGASFVFQFVAGTEREPLSMQRDPLLVFRWCDEAGYRNITMTNDDRFENWRWVHARNT